MELAKRLFKEMRSVGKNTKNANNIANSKIKKAMNSVFKTPRDINVARALVDTDISPIVGADKHRTEKNSTLDNREDQNVLSAI